MSKVLIYSQEDLDLILELEKEKNEELQQENKILRENAENNDKVVDKVNWENMLLKKENEQLKKQVDEYKKLGFKYLQDKNNSLETQQKEFIKYLEDEIQKKREKTTTLTSFIRNVVPLKHCLQKYKSIIGVSDENSKN